MAPTKKETRRGSPEAIAKRRSARKLNTLFERGVQIASIDGRTLKRKNRMLKELKEGRGGVPLKAQQVLAYATELFEMGENLGTIRALKPLLPERPPLTPEVVEAMRATQEAYNFSPRAWRLLGVDIEKIMGSSTSAEAAAPRRARAKSGRRRKAA
ncbi:MAG TPA: hypothetical protein VIL20_09790 [Sandaracinaceae bacterium]